MLVLGGAAVGLAVALFLRTRMPRAAVVGLVAMAGAALGAGGLLIEGDPAPLDWALTPSLLALSLPVHARIALGPLGGGGADGDPSASSERGHELLEHTADIGIRAWGRRLEDAFEEAAVVVADILGARAEAAA